MIAKARHHRRGSVVIMVVGLLTLLAMIGSTLVIVSFLDRREARSVAATVPMKNVAGSVLGRIGVRLADDLYISDNGTPNDPSDDVLYGLADTVAKRIDYPSETVDKHLASFDPHYDTATSSYVWKHVSNIPGNLPTPADVPLTEARLADTDRVALTLGATSYWGDSLLWDSGMKDPAGRHLMVAERVVDAGGLLAVNLAHRPAAATGGRVMPITDLSLVPLLGSVTDADTVRNARLDPAYPGDTIVDYWINYALRPNNVGANREYYPFTVEDMLAAAWFATPRPSTGRLYTTLGAADFAAARRYLTVPSVGRIGVAPGRTSTIPAPVLADLPGLTRQLYKADLNKAEFPALFNAFYNQLAHLAGPEPEAVRRTAAAQLAVNAIDFRDTDSNPTRKKVPGVAAYVYGIERQPFLVEAAYTRLENAGTIENYYAIELFNPFETDIDISNWRIKVGAAAHVPMPVNGGNTLPAGGRMVIVNDASSISVPGGVRKEELDTLDLTQEVLILRPCVVTEGDPPVTTTYYIVVDSINWDEFTNNPQTDPAAGEVRAECLRRDDVLPHAFYALRLYSTSADDITTVAGAASLGKENVGVTLPAETKPCPVYVRNGNFINVADACRVMVVGPGEDVSLSHGLTSTTSLYNGRLDMGGNIPGDPFWGAGIPVIPLGCMPWDFLMVHSPMDDTVDNERDGLTDSADTNGGEDLVYGRVNINTAPHEVLQCLPSLASLPPVVGGDRDKIVRELLCYRDLDDNTAAVGVLPGSGGGSAYKTSGRATALGILNLRNEPGFASVGEIVLPLLARASKADIAVENRLPKDTYSSNQAPDNYALSLAQDGTTLTDDGLSAAAATRVSGDLVKHHVYASWLSNHVTVRSDVYLAYIAVYGSTAEGSGVITSVGGNALEDSTKNWKVDKWRRQIAQEEQLHVVVLKDSGPHEIRQITASNATTLTVSTTWSGVQAGDRYQILSVKRRYVALIDRSNVRSVRDRPEVLMFAEVR